MKKAEEFEKELGKFKEKGKSWILSTFPLVVELTKTIRECGDAFEAEIAPLMAIIEEIKEKYKPELTALAALDQEVRKKILQYHRGVESVTVPDVSGEYRFPERWGYDVVDVLKVPCQYLTVDNKAVREAIKNGMVSIKGLQILKKRSLTIYTKKNGE